MTEPLQLSRAHALCVYAEPIVSGRRVVVIGDASLGLGARLADLGARIVHVYDPNAERVQWATRTPLRGVTVRDLPQGEFDVRDGAFDVAIVPDLGSFANPQALVARLRRLIGAEGVFITAARNSQVATGGAASATLGGALDYYELYDLVSMQFEAVRMVGQVPFVGLTLAELGETEEAPQVSVDTQLVVASEPPEAFIAVGCSTRVFASTASRLEAYAIVQLPADTFGATSAAAPVVATLAVAVALADAPVAPQGVEPAPQPSPPPVDEERVRALEMRAGDSLVRAERLAHEVARLEEELERQRERGFRLVRDVEDEKKARVRAEQELGIVRQSPDVVAIRERIIALEDALRAADAANRELAMQNATLAEDALSGTVHLRGEMQQALAVVSDSHAEEMTRLEAEIDRRTEATRLLEAELARAIDSQASHAAEIERFEDVLRERAQALVLLEQELVQHEAAARELVELRGRLDALALETARREADVQTSAWRIAELEQRGAMLEARARDAEARVEELSSSAASPPAASESPAASASAPVAVEHSEELTALRQALAQEHAARARLESGDALARARAEIERQAVLLEQMSRELDRRDRDALAAATQAVEASVVAAENGHGPAET